MKKRLSLIAAILALALALAAVGSAEVVTIEEGLRGSHVRQVQARLSQLGFYTGQIDGIFGELTLEAVRAFQRMNGLEPDGVIGPDTAARLYALEALNSEGAVHPDVFEIRVGYGYNGPVVVVIQEHLTELGFYQAEVDGLFGSATRQAVRDFQVANGLQEDGIVGPDTWSVMFSDVIVSQANDPAFTVLPPSELPPVTQPAVPAEPTQAPTERPILLDGGAQGELVLYVQQRLAQLGYYAGEPDGRYGETTEQAVLLFQAANNLQIDGIVGPQTWAALQDVNAVPNPALAPTAAP
ncbi:MAG TPA: peptidoglycan-binding protein [Candidatus Limnocylindria bacterium]|nr:peptidoglycan-binding protein [Candidatus Limnocylindria bacterium]